jgi:hypothetical protein
MAPESRNSPLLENGSLTHVSMKMQNHEDRHTEDRQRRHVSVGGMRQSYFAGSSMEHVKFLWQAECKWDIPAPEGDLMLITARPVLVGVVEPPANYIFSSEVCKLDKLSETTKEFWPLISVLDLNRSPYKDGLRVGSPGFDSGQYKTFVFSTASEPILQLTKPSIQWVPGSKTTTHLHLVSRSEKCGSIPPLPHTSLWRSA